MTSSPVHPGSELDGLNPLSRCRVLVVDDDADTRVVATLALAAAGFDVGVAADAAAGRALYDAAGPYAAVVLDLTLPGLSGEELFVALRRARPEQPVVIVGHDVDPGVASLLRQEPGVVLLSRPFTGEQLVAAVRQVAARPAR